MDVLKSRTTQNVTWGGLCAGAIALIFVWARERWNLPWSSQEDEVVIAAIMTILTPVLSRKLAFIRNPEKRVNGKES